MSQYRTIEHLIDAVIEADQIQLDHQLWSFVDNYEFELEREDEGDDWYIQVRPVDRSYLYDGWWKGSAFESKQDAIREAIRGAGLWRAENILGVR